MFNPYITDAEKPIPILPVLEDTLEPWLAERDDRVRKWVSHSLFKAGTGEICVIPDLEGSIQEVLLGLGSSFDHWAFGALPKQLPEGVYRIALSENLELAALGWGLGCYQFDRFQPGFPFAAKLFLPDSIDADEVQFWQTTIFMVRDLINTPTDNMHPEDLAAAVEKVGTEFNAQVTQVVGEDLLTENFPLVHAVGRGSDHPPRLIELRWGDQNAPEVTIVGKGVCFDSGGYDLKPPAGMRNMKKDMAGSANALGLARMLMWKNLPIRLRLIIPAVENLVSGRSYKPGDVMNSRGGKTVEIHNTDAEGRLVLADALALGVETKPARLIDFATLTGAATVALGPRMPAFFCNDNTFAQSVLASSDKTCDFMWRMPLHQPYRDYFKSEIAYMMNASEGPFAGSITAALFLQTFVPEEVSWAHFDMNCWNHTPSPGRPVGAEAMAIRAVYDAIVGEFSQG